MKRFALVLVGIIAWGALAQAADTKLVLETPEILAPFAPLVMSRIERAGVAAEVRFTPFVRLSQDLASSSIDGAFFLSEAFLKNVPNYVVVPVPLYRNEYLAFTLPGGPKIRSAPDLKGKKVAYPRGYVGMAALAEGAEVTTVVDEEQGFRLLGAGRVEVLIASRTSSQMFGAAAGRPLEVHEPPLVVSLLYLVLHQSLVKENQALTTVFQRSLQDGSWERDVQEVIRHPAGPK